MVETKKRNGRSWKLEHEILKRKYDELNEKYNALKSKPNAEVSDGSTSQTPKSSVQGGEVEKQSDDVTNDDTLKKEVVETPTDEAEATLNTLEAKSKEKEAEQPHGENLNDTSAGETSLEIADIEAEEKEKADQFEFQCPECQAYFNELNNGRCPQCATQLE